MDNLRERIGTVMIIDDEAMVTTSLKTMLALETRHLVHTFNDPAEALDKLADVRPDVVISDFSMPGMDGITLLKNIKERQPETTLILLTGYADKESAIEAINSVGIYRYIEKPWDNEELKISIANGLERAHLVNDLRQTVDKLTEARGELEATNRQLEALVEARTQDLQTTYRKLQSIVNNIADGIITLNARHEVTSLNPAAERLLISQFPDLETSRPLSQPLEKFLALPEGKLAGLLDDTGGTGRAMKEALLGRLPVEVSIASLAGEGDNADGSEDSGHVLVLRDITQRKEIERLRDDFVSTLTHDLRTPLLAAIQSLNFFMDGTLGDVPEKQLEMVRMLIDSKREMLGLVNVLLEVYKYEAGRQRLVFDAVDTAGLLEAVCQELNALAASREQSLNVILPARAEPNGFHILGDKQELRRVFVNLIGNAINHTPRGGRIEVALANNPDAAEQVISVTDDGRGIPKDDLPHLFQRFSQGTSNKRSSGSGLGLYLSRQIVEAHEGRVWVESPIRKSRDNAGSRFSVSLPLRQ